MPSLGPGAASMPVPRTPFPEPVDDIAFPTTLAARLAISVQISKPLGGLPEPDRAFIDALLAETLDRNTVATRVREHFKTAGRG